MLPVSEVEMENLKQYRPAAVSCPARSVSLNYVTYFVYINRILYSNFEITYLSIIANDSVVVKFSPTALKYCCGVTSRPKVLLALTASRRVKVGKEFHGGVAPLGQQYTSSLVQKSTVGRFPLGYEFKACSSKTKFCLFNNVKK